MRSEKNNELLTGGFAIVGLDGSTISNYTQFSFSSSLTEFPHHRKAPAVSCNAIATVQS